MGIKEEAEKKMSEALDHFKTEIRSIRTGQANPSLLDGVMVEVYGTNMRLKDIASVSIPEPRQLLISPFDKSNTSLIGKSIEKANLNVQPIAEGDVVRINIPPMDENLRKEMVKQCNKKREEGKVSIRNTRRDSNESIKKQKADGDLPEDLAKKLEKEVQELTDRFCKEIDEEASRKESDILTI